MEAFEKLLEIADTLLGEEGCPWDREQTFKSLQPYLLEESHEVIEAVDEERDDKVLEELGDLLNVIVFYCKIAAKEDRFSMKDVLEALSSKLIRRHPHVFGEEKAETAEEVISHWEKIKAEEKEIKKRKSLLEGIPKTLKGLLRAQKVIHKIKKHQDLFAWRKEKKLDEEMLGNELIELIYHADAAGIDVEGALRRTLSLYENSFRKWEEEQLESKK